MVSATSYATRDVSSLRAAALLTLKPKSKFRPVPRRTSPEHPDDTSSIASTLRAPPSPELDYGSDDASADNQIHSVIDEGKEEGEKEDGEISEDETQRVPQTSFLMEDVDNEPLPGLTSILNHDTNGNALSGLNGSIQLSGPPGSRRSTSNPQPTNIADKLPSQFVASSVNSSSSQFSMPSSLFMPGSIKLDAEHVRPSLRMTVEEFIEAKEIILDLLGWNVPPDYLINCGLTREAIYYVFTELNLKLPSNLDISGITLYRPPGESLQTVIEQQSDKQKSTSPTPIPQSSTIRPGSFVHPRPESPSPPLSPTTAKIYTSSASIQSPRDSVSFNTVDMYSEPIPGLQSTFSPHQSHATVITRNGDQTARPTKEIPRHIYTGNLDEIETLRRQELLARKAALASRRKLDLKKQTILTTSVNTTVPKSPTISPVVTVEAVDNFLKSITSNTASVSTPTGADDVDVVMEDNEPQPPTPSTSSSVAPVPIPLPKKPASKRAVASDWIDYEASSRNGSSNGYGEYADIRKPSTLSFANVVSNQKVVIDFSDSEDDSPAEDLSRPMNATIGTVLQTINRLGPREVTNITRRTPEALLLKEQEIKRMKELIAERERNRLKKLTNPPKGVTPPPVDFPPESLIPEETGIDNNEQQTADLPIKQEHDITPPLDPPNADIGTPTKQEDSVMQDVPIAGIQLFQLRTGGSLFIDKETATVQAELMTESPASDTSSFEVRDVQMDDSFLVSEHKQVASVVPVPNFSRQPYVHPEAPQTEAASSSTGRFTSYLSPLSPFLFSRSSLVTDVTSLETDATPSSSSLVLFPPILVDRPISEQISHLLRPLRDEVVSKLDPMTPLCHFEVPGGGKCQDSTCRNSHLRDFEPTDDQIAEYLSRVLPEPQPSFQMIRTGLSRVRASKQEIDFDDRIIQALDHLGVR